MNKTNIKTESVAEFLARGGVIAKLPSKGTKKPRTKKEVVEVKETLEDVDLSNLPAALKIKYGIKG